MAGVHLRTAALRRAMADWRHLARKFISARQPSRAWRQPHAAPSQQVVSCWQASTGPRRRPRPGDGPLLGMAADQKSAAAAQVGALELWSSRQASIPARQHFKTARQLSAAPNLLLFTAHPPTLRILPFALRVPPFTLRILLFALREPPFTLRILRFALREPPLSLRHFPSSTASRPEGMARWRRK